MLFTITKNYQNCYAVIFIQYCCDLAINVSVHCGLHRSYADTYDEVLFAAEMLNIAYNHVTLRSTPG